MSSTQHQLIEQCAIRLRGIVEALDNIHDSTQHRSPHRWSTDLDDVHSSAESLLALINDQASPPCIDCKGTGFCNSISGEEIRCPCHATIQFADPAQAPVEQFEQAPPSEDQLTAAGLSYPLAKEDAVNLWYAGFRSEVVTVLEAWEAIGHDIGMNPSKGELLDSLRNIAAICNAHGNDMPAQSAIDQRQAIADAITGALAFGAQASRPPPADHWLRPFYDIGRAEGQRTQELAMLVRMLASSLKRHAPESNLVARATNYLAAKGLAGTPLRDAPASVEQVGGDERAAFELFVRKHCGMPAHIAVNWDAKFTNDAWEGWQARAALAQPSPLQAEQIEGAQGERKLSDLGNELHNLSCAITHTNEEWAEQISSIAGELWKWPDRAALARVAELESATSHIEVRQCVNCRNIGINDAADYAACHDCRWTGPEPDEDKCPGCAGENCMAAACPECGGRYELVAEAKISTPAAQAGQVPQAWLDVQAERRRQVEAEGWTPEHDDEHDSGEIACAAACYALPPAHPARIEGALGRYGRDPNIWPWTRDWWKPAPNDRRRELIKAGALVLAEIERLDRAAATQGGPRDA
ncbi:hypothetical protein FVA82_11730 [Pseudomonas aeruginosa]|uniref:hypothetical protein n=1 Tax=Pseudomonas aeruginosa TaxID=287 RepID=UPI00123CEDBE|nr:hypothetical protein [Pseudomonas aeruginosa]QES82045.1 hypothetical protein FVA82_11730 [Pseudomonas aeruginosa]